MSIHGNINAIFNANLHAAHWLYIDNFGKEKLLVIDKDTDFKILFTWISRDHLL